jgi:hypothetical protein
VSPYRALLRNLWPVCRSIVEKAKSNVRSPFFGVLPSDRIPKAVKHVFIHSSNSCKLHQRKSVSYNGEFRELFEDAIYIRMFLDRWDWDNEASNLEFFNSVRRWQRARLFFPTNRTILPLSYQKGF